MSRSKGRAQHRRNHRTRAEQPARVAGPREQVDLAEITIAARILQQLVSGSVRFPVQCDGALILLRDRGLVSIMPCRPTETLAWLTGDGLKLMGTGGHAEELGQLMTVLRCLGKKNA